MACRQPATRFRCWPGSRLTGRVGGWSVGALNIQQREQRISPSTNFTALRARRDILANSDVGVMFLNKDPQGGDYNRGFGADANFRFFRDLTMNFAGAKSATPASRVPGSGDDWYSKSGFGYRGNVLETRAMYQTIGARFNDEMGFVPRVGVDNFEGYFGTHLRFKKFSGWMRETFPHFQIENFTRRNGGGLESRYMDWHWPVTFQNSAFVEVGTNPNVEVIDDRFTINSRRGIVVEPGRYDFKEHFVLANSNAAAPFSMNLRYGNGEFYDGYRRNYTIGGTCRMNEHINVSLSDQINDIDLAVGLIRHPPGDRPRQLLLQHQGVRERAGAVQHRHQPVELERPARHHPSPAQRHLPGLQRASRFAQRRADLARGDREDDLPVRLLAGITLRIGASRRYGPVSSTSAILRSFHFTIW